MAGNFLVVDIEAPPADPIPKSVDWGKCNLCQIATQEKITNPRDNRRSGGGDSYITFQNAIEEYNELGQLSSLPFEVPYKSLKAEGSISDSLTKHNAVWHKSCYREISTSRLERARKRSKKAPQDPQKMSPMKMRRTSVPFSEESCELCTSPGTEKDPLHLIMKKEVGDNIKQCAQDLQDRRLMARLAGALDLVALGAKYHLGCYVGIKKRRETLVASQKRISESTNSGFDQMSEYVMAGIASYIDTVKDTSPPDEKSPVFKLSDLMKMFDQGMREYGFKSESHTSRFKDRLLNKCPYLEACGEGRGQPILIVFRSDMEFAVRTSCLRNYLNEGLEMLSVVKAVRKDIFDHPECDWEETSSEKVNACVPNSLKALVTMLLRGPAGSGPDDDVEPNEAVSTISQLIFFNAVRRTTKSKTRRHNRSRETPVPVYLALKVYNDTRSKKLIEFTNTLGLSISYDRVKAIVRDKANEVCDQYHSENVVCPPALLKGLFTTAAADNIDHNLSSNTAVGSFHGTAMSLVQHPLPREEGTKREKCESVKRKTVSTLPDEYVLVQPCSLNVKSAKCPPGLPCTIEVNDENSPLQEELQWLDNAANELHTPWAVFHSQLDSGVEERRRTSTALLPILPETAHSLATMLHCMKIVSSCTEFLNPGQTPVMTVDQPLYALCKQIQLLMPEQYGENKFFLVLGGLHIELAALRVVGQWLEGSGWTDVLVEAGVTTSGRADSILKATHIVRSRYAHEVSAAVLYSLQKEAFEMSTGQDCDSTADFEFWRKEQMKCPQFKYWNTVLELQLLLFQFVRAIRTANFSLYGKSLVRLLPWFFILDHVNYARWLSVHVRDLTKIQDNAPDVADRFKQGQFVAKKTDRKFSCIALDHSHEQMNAEIKGSGGFEGLTENPEALRKWMLGSPEIVSLVAKYQVTVLGEGEDEDTRHHSNSAHSKNRFATNYKSLRSVILLKGNPFLEVSEDLYNIFTKNVASEDVVSTVFSAEDRGRFQYLDFVKERLEDGSKRIMDPIKTNKVALFGTVSRKGQDNMKVKMMGLKSDRDLFSRLYIACQTRDGNLEEFFAHENQPCPPSLSTDIGEMRVCAKSDLVKCLTGLNTESTSDSIPKVDVRIIDGAFLVNFLVPSATLKTFRDYAERLFGPFIRNVCSDVQRLDIVWDRYFPDSLKTHTRDKRGQGVRVKVSLETSLPKGWPNFLRDSSNKEALFSMLAQWLVQQSWSDVTLITTCGPNVLSSRANDVTSLSPCSHEEADTRIMLHVSDAVSKGYRKVIIRTGDTDVLVLAVSIVHAIPSLEELWLHLGTGINQQYVSAHSIAASLGLSRASALPVFHAITGCDTVSAFFGRGKKTGFEAWNQCPEVTQAFSSLTTANYDDIRDVLETFIVKMYDRSSQCADVNETRKFLFIKKNRDICSIPPTSDALKQHALRAAYQGGFIWGNSLQVQLSLPDPSNWGWTRPVENERWTPKWTDRPPAQEACMELIKCGCKKGCTEKRCRCIKQNMPCSPLCFCDGLCGQS